MRKTALPSIAIIAFLLLLGLAFSAGTASAQFDRADMSKPVSDLNNTGNTPHGGGDPDNPVPVLGPGQCMMGAEEVEHHEEIYGLPAERRGIIPLVPFAYMVKDAIASILLF